MYWCPFAVAASVVRFYRWKHKKKRKNSSACTQRREQSPLLPPPQSKKHFPSRGTNGMKNMSTVVCFRLLHPSLSPPPPSFSLPPSHCRCENVCPCPSILTSFHLYTLTCGNADVDEVLHIVRLALAQLLAVDPLRHEHPPRRELRVVVRDHHLNRDREATTGTRFNATGAATYLNTSMTRSGDGK